MKLNSCLLFVLCISVELIGAENSPSKMLSKMLNHCTNTVNMDVLRCFKIQALKAVERALNAKSLPIFDGIVNIVSENSRRQGKALISPQLSESKLADVNETKIDELLMRGASEFVSTRRIDIQMPRLLEEARRRNKGNQMGLLMWALAIKGTFLAMAYKGIAIMAGTALIVGKMALILSAILGLKKLVSSGHEKTTFEIVKQPKYSEIHSNSYEDEGHHYRRSMDEGTNNSLDDYNRVNNDPYRGYAM